VASVLIVEDEAVIALMLEDMVKQAGHQVYGTAATIAQATALLRNGRPDVALLDLRLAGGELSYPLAAELKQLDVPFAFMTGYEEQTVDKAFAPTVVLRKPVQEEDILTMLRSVLPS
jgi:CheY-like chemotaxis protein